MNEGILSESTKKINALLKIRGILCIFFSFSLDIISRSTYHIISYHTNTYSMGLYKLRDNKTDVDLK